MSRFDLDLESVNEDTAREIASRQILSFLIPSEDDSLAPSPVGLRLAPSKSLFSLAVLPDGAVGAESPYFRWESLDIYDVDGQLLFRDLTLRLDSQRELRVRTAASSSLGSPVWMVKTGPALNIKALIAATLGRLRGHPVFQPLVIGGKEDDRPVCYSYPKLGILCRMRSDPDATFVTDIGDDTDDLTIVPVEPLTRQVNPESEAAVWSPFDIVVPSTVAAFTSLWEHHMALLPPLPEKLEGMREKIIAARESIIEERTISPELQLKPQKTKTRCAAATAEMILHYHGITDKDQRAIADAMGAGLDGATPDAQAAAIPALSTDKLKAELDKDTTFSEAQDEIRANRPFKTGGPIHARACGGFRAERGEKNWLYIYDPWPANKGDIYYQIWLQEQHRNYMYVRPLQFL